MSQTSKSIDTLWKVLLIIVLVVYGCMAASHIIIPIVFSFFLAIILNPVVKFLERKGVNNILAISITLLVMVFVLSSGIYFISVQSTHLLTDIPDLVEKFKSFLDRIELFLSDITGISSKDQLSILKENTDQMIASGSSFFTDAISATSHVLTFISLVPIYVFFILLYRKNFKKFLILISDGNGDSVLSMTREIKSMIHSYISGLLIVISIIAVLNTVGLLALGIKYALFLGVLSAILTIIPYIGIFIGGLLPVLVAFLTKDSLLYPLGVIGVFALVQFLEGNFITPNVIGSKVNVNPLAAIIALLIGSAVWGIIGMILAIPLTGVAQIILSHNERFRPYAILLSSAQKHVDDEDTVDSKISRKIKDSLEP